MSATEVCSPITSTVSFFQTSQVTCRPESELHADLIQTVECSNFVMSGYDSATRLAINERDTSVKSSPHTTAEPEVTSQLQAVKLSPVEINTQEKGEDDEIEEGEKQKQAHAKEERDEGEEVPELIEEPPVSASNELTVEASVSPLDILYDVAYELEDAIGDLAQATECKLRDFIHRPNSVQQLPENNVHVIHPRTKEAIGFGLHIEEHRDGCHVARVIEDGLAFKSKLQFGDIISNVNGFDLKGFTLENIAEAFTKVNVQEQINLVINRLVEDDDGQFHNVEIQIIITLTLSDDNVTFEVDVEVTSSYLRYQSRTKRKYISQNPTGRSPQYLIVDGNRAFMSTFTDKKAHFQMELYQGGSRGRRVCVLRHDTSSLIIDQRGRSNNQLIATAAPNPNRRKIISNPGSKFFYWYAHPNSAGEDVFESVSKKDFFINVTSGNSLVLQQFSSASNVPSSARFKVVDV